MKPGGDLASLCCAWKGGSLVKRIVFWAFCIWPWCFLCQCALAKGDGYTWKLLKEKEGISVFVSKTPGSKFNTYKASGIIDKPWEVIFEVLLDVPNYPHWMPGCRKAGIVKMLDERLVKGHFVIYLVWDALWPARNRDLVVTVNSIHDWENDHVVVELNETDKYPVPREKGLVRVEDFYARFDFKYIDRTHTYVEFINLVNPGGVVPPAIADFQTVTVPYKTIHELGKRAAEPIYYKRAMSDYY